MIQSYQDVDVFIIIINAKAVGKKKKRCAITTTARERNRDFFLFFCGANLHNTLKKPILPSCV
jgi:hypothetical protein